MTTATIPILVTEAAAGRAAELGRQEELEQMLAHTLRHVSGLRSIRVTLEWDPEYPETNPKVVIWGHREEPPGGADLDHTDWDWGGWQTATFPPEVCLHFVMASAYGDAGGW